MPGVERILVPGEQSHATWLERTSRGVPMPPSLLAELERLAQTLGIEPLS
jgi:LDH2 family malate/lactate/ureidoglycolate dehydrogenase